MACIDLTLSAGHAAVALRADVQQVVAALAGDVDQVADERLVGFPGVVVVAVAPGRVQRHAGLPIHAGHAGGGDVLLRRDEVAVLRIELRRCSPRCPCSVQPASGVRKRRLFMMIAGCFARTSCIRSNARQASSP